MVALSDFWLLHGFKKEEDLNRILNNVHELSFLKKDLRLQDIKVFMKK